MLHTQTPLIPGADPVTAVAQAKHVLETARARGVNVVLPVDFATLKQGKDPKESGETPVVMTLEEIGKLVDAKSTFCNIATHHVHA